jgi:hypothetical protein
MDLIQDVIVPQELKSPLYFCCHIEKCKGACCVAGDAGAPIDPIEIEQIQNTLPFVKPYMQEEAALFVNEQNFFDYDTDGNFVTSLIDDRECIFTNFTSGIAYCAIEKAFVNKKISFRKPLSCFLYPIRVTREGAFLKINYHQWDICVSAKQHGQQQRILLVDFLKEPLKQKFGKEWYKLFYNLINMNDKSPKLK